MNPKKILVYGLIAVILAPAAIGCSGKNNAGHNDQTEKIAELTRQLEMVTAELEAAQAAGETTGRGREDRDASNEEQSSLNETQAPDETPPAGTADASSASQGSTAQAAVPAAETSAPRYVIGDNGPGGGIVFSTGGGRNWEVFPRTFTETEISNMSKGDWRSLPYNGVNWSAFLTMDQLRTIRANLQKTGKVNFGTRWIMSTLTDRKGVQIPDWLQNRNFVRGEDFPGCPGYQIILVGGGDGNYCMRMSDGMCAIMMPDGWIQLLNDKEESFLSNEEAVYLLIRSF